jgi:predicted anti-sigma-YlaC factor YlaD
MNCVELLDVVSDALDGTLAEGARAGFDEHLRACAACRNYVEQLKISVESLKRIPREGRPNPRRDALIEAYRKKFRG